MFVDFTALGFEIEVIAHPFVRTTFDVDNFPDLLANGIKQRGDMSAITLEQLRRIKANY